MHGDAIGRFKCFEFWLPPRCQACRCGSGPSPTISKAKCRQLSWKLYLERGEWNACGSLDNAVRRVVIHIVRMRAIHITSLIKPIKPSHACCIAQSACHFLFSSFAFLYARLSMTCGHLWFCIWQKLFLLCDNFRGGWNWEPKRPILGRNTDNFSAYI